MTPPPEIPFLRVAGTYREVGAAIGAACRDTVVRACDAATWELPSGRTVAEHLTLADRYADATRPAWPWVFEELEGCAEAAGVEPRALWACCIEEIWYEPRVASRTGAAIDGRCSDLVAVAPATADGHTLTAHNNDLNAGYMDELVAIERTCGEDPTVLTIGNGIWISVGWNDAGLNLTGNELSPNDERIGIPREVQVRAMLRERTLDAMVGVALRHDRASSYNNVLAHASGDVVNVEGSAMVAELTEPDERGHLVHTNHYVCERMLPLEGDPQYALHSAVRYQRAAELLEGTPDGSITMDVLRTFLSDHEHAPDSLCRHPHPDRNSVTCFWCIADLTEGVVRYGRGNPCDSLQQEYTFEDAAVA